MRSGSDESLMGLLIQFKKLLWPTKSYVWIRPFLAHMDPSYKADNTHSFFRPLYFGLLGNLFTALLEQDIFSVLEGQ